MSRNIIAARIASLLLWGIGAIGIHYKIEPFINIYWFYMVLISIFGLMLLPIVLFACSQTEGISAEEFEKDWSTFIKPSNVVSWGISLLSLLTVVTAGWFVVAFVYIIGSLAAILAKSTVKDKLQELKGLETQKK